MFDAASPVLVADRPVNDRPVNDLFVFEVDRLPVLIAVSNTEEYGTMVSPSREERTDRSLRAFATAIALARLSALSDIFSGTTTPAAAKPVSVNPVSVDTDEDAWNRMAQRRLRLGC